MTRSLPSIDNLKKVLTEISTRYPILKVELFGSLASGESNSSSDIDLLVDFTPDSQVELFEMGALKEDLEEKLGFSVDLISRRAIENSSNSYIRKSILASPLPLIHQVARNERHYCP